MKRSTLKHLFFWRFAQLSIGPSLVRLFRVKPIWHTNSPKDSAFILVANHANRSDPFIIGNFIRTPINYMANVDGVTGFNRLFSSGLGCFNIRKGRPDSQAFVKAMEILKNGYSVGIFVEGDRTWLGETKEFSTVTASLAIKMNVPVLMAKISGNYFSRPRWSEIPRRGKAFVEFKQITRDEIRQLTKEELQQKIAAYISNNDFLNEKIQSIKFKGKNLAVGVERVMWKCPACETEDKLKGIGDEIFCNACNKKFSIDGNQNVWDNESILKTKKIANLREWNIWQFGLALEKLKNPETKIFLSDPEIEMYDEPSNNNWRCLGKGEMTLSKEGIEWKSKEDPSKILSFPIKEILNIVDNFNEYSILNLKRDRYKFFSFNTSSYKWSSLLEMVQKQG